MYLTKSEISHIALVLDENRIAHAVPDRGVVVDPIESLLVTNNRLLVGKRSIAPHDQPQFESRAVSTVGQRYDFLGVASKGIAILIGRVPGYFRISFVADVLVLLAALDVPTLLLLHHPLILWCGCSPVSVAALLVGTVLGHLQPYVPETPASLLYGLLRSGSTVIADGFLASRQTVHAPGLAFELRRPRNDADTV
jgi:hypothetical protein